MAIFFILVIASSVLLYFVSRKQSSLEGADSSVRLSAQSGFQCEFAEAQKFYPFGDGVLKVTNDRIAYLTLSGNEAYSFGVSYTNPFCVFGKDRALVCDLDGYAFSVCDKEGLIYSKSTGSITLGITIYKKYLSSFLCQRCRQVNSSSSLSYSALLICYCNNFSHSSPFLIRSIIYFNHFISISHRLFIFNAIRSLYFDTLYIVFYVSRETLSGIYPLITLQFL